MPYGIYFWVIWDIFRGHMENIFGWSYGVYFLNHVGYISKSYGVYFGIICGICWGHIGYILGSYAEHFQVISGIFPGHMGYSLGSYEVYFGVIYGIC